MSVKIRLQRRGKKKQPFYHIVIANSRSPRDGRFIEKIGTYNPLTKPATILIDRDKAYDWLTKGAQPTDTVRAILRFKGVMYKKHLMDGVKKGALSQEDADAKLISWIEEKEAKISARVEKTRKETEAFHAKVAGAKKVEKPKEVEPAPAPVSEQSSSEVIEAPVAEVAAEEVVEAVVANTVAEEASEVVAESTVESTEEPVAEAEEEAPAVTEETTEDSSSDA